MAEGSKWLARRAAWHHDQEFITASAAAYACESAEVTYTNTQQVSGAIGITTEHGLVLWNLRLLALRAALGGQRMHARRVAAARRQMDLSGVPSPLHPA
jgi:alkylation response protein AidB-like acyl-CoA dehydrogenase